MSAFEPRWQLRTQFATSLSEIYGLEVPAYNTLVEVSREVNREVLDGILGTDRTRLGHSVIGEVDRVSSERHGAIRLGSAREMRQAARIFSVFGMYPVGFYDLREAAKKSVPVVATCFRPIEAEELARHPFRVFTSMLVTDDRRFFSPELQQQLDEFIAARTLFSPELMQLVEQAEAEGGLNSQQGARFVELACDALKLSRQPIPKTWYETLQAISSVAADIGAEHGTHINHLTPRVLDIDSLYRKMEDRGITMIDHIQGPPRWSGPLVLLRQTSFRALDEERRMVDDQGRSVAGKLRVRFGEVEARGVALTPEGRALYDRLVAETEEGLAREPGAAYQDVASALFDARFPRTYDQLARQGLAYFHYRPTELGLRLGPVSQADPLVLLQQGHVAIDPIVYEDFLPKSAAGIFQSNLTGDGSRNDHNMGSRQNAVTLSKTLGRQILDPYSLYRAQQEASIAQTLAAIGYGRSWRKSA